MRTLVGIMLFLLSFCQGPTARVPAETWAFCGIHPDDRYAAQTVRGLAAAGIDATMGPCMPAPEGYTAYFPGTRYVAPETYLRLVQLNASVGIQTVVYDARLWSEDSVVRNSAIEFWRPHLTWVRAWDMGDEFNPNYVDWDYLVTRWNIMIEVVSPATGIGPFTNHMGWAAGAALRDLRSAGSHLSFDQYDGDRGVSLARSLDGQVNHLMCAVNTYRHGEFRPSGKTVTRDIVDLRAAGCDSFLIFGGAMPYVDGFGSSSVVTRSGVVTEIGRAILKTA